MSRVGKKIIEVPAGVTVTVSEENKVTVKGPKGELTQNINTNIEIAVEATTVELKCENNAFNAIYGTSRALINNMVVGVSKGFQKDLEIRGVGYRAALKGKVLNLSLGHSHPVDLTIPEGLTVEVPKNTEIKVSGIDKQLVGEFAANIRRQRPVEPYKGKGVRYVGEYVIRKEGKKAK